MKNSGHYLRIRDTHYVTNAKGERRKVVGWEVHEREWAVLVSQLMRRACLAEGITVQGLMLYSDNGSPMKGACNDWV